MHLLDMGQFLFYFASIRPNVALQIKRASVSSSYFSIHVYTCVDDRDFKQLTHCFIFGPVTAV